MLATILIVGCIFLGATFAVPDCSKIPTKDDMIDCCKLPGFMHDVIIRCSDKYPADGKTYFCHGECLLNSTGFLVNGQIQSDKAAAIIDELFKDFPDFIPVTKPAFPKCEDLVKQGLPKLKEKNLEIVDDCDPFSSLLASCFYIETVVNCPTAKWQNKDSCNETKEYLEHCTLKL